MLLSGVTVTIYAHNGERVMLQSLGPRTSESEKLPLGSSPRLNTLESLVMGLRN